MVEIHGIAGVTDMPAAADIVRVQDIKPNNAFTIHRHAAIRLRRKELPASFCGQRFFLWKSYTVFYYAIPDGTIAERSASLYFRTIIFCLPPELYVFYK